MKKILFLFIMAIAPFSIQAKDILPENVPDKVKSYISKHYSKVNNIEWEDKSKKGYYEAEFTLSRQRNRIKDRHPLLVPVFFHLHTYQ